MDLTRPGRVQLGSDLDGSSPPGTVLDMAMEHSDVALDPSTQSQNARSTRQVSSQRRASASVCKGGTSQ
uniref:Uncharacterized protein n=1 Tax=Physcomitrium patens TaxID=3218 RepID=A0A2K1JEA6_PHYPA|nr:hypothetical protein PHYPA_020146 [Physcomitrium patens]